MHACIKIVLETLCKVHLFDGYSVNDNIIYRFYLKPKCITFKPKCACRIKLFTFKSDIIHILSISHMQGQYS